MSVVINDFEIVLDPQPEGARSNGAAAPEAPQQAPLRPLDIDDVIERKTRRELRLRAH